MDVQSKLSVFAAVVAIGIGAAAPSFAQSTTPDPGKTAGKENPVHCDPGADGARNYCGNERVKYTIESPSPGACIKGQTWGSDERGLWVSGGCSADFDGVAAIPPRHHH